MKNKLRSALSTLGIVIGISSVTIILALGEGFRDKLLENLASSNDTIVITPKADGGGSSPGINTGAKKEDKPFVKAENIFTRDVLTKISSYVSNIQDVLPQMRVGGGTITFAGKEVYGSVIGVDSRFFVRKKSKFTNGFSITSEQVDASAKVAVIGHNIVTDYLKGVNPLGKPMSIGGYAYTVIGILEKSTDWDQNSAIYVPITTAEKSLGGKGFDTITIYVNDIQKLQATKKNLLYLLMKLSGVSSPQETKFQVQSNDEVIKQINESMAQFQLLLGGIAGISLLVGGIGIMNIMLVSVIERTREIGIRKAIGAKRKDILLQFLTESVVVTALGCVMALGISYLATFMIARYTPLPARISLSVLSSASGISVLMGLVFGIMPAWKAAKLTPIVALRSE